MGWEHGLPAQICHGKRDCNFGDLLEAGPRIPIIRMSSLRGERPPTLFGVWGLPRITWKILHLLLPEIELGFYPARVKLKHHQVGLLSTSRCGAVLPTQQPITCISTGYHFATYQIKVPAGNPGLGLGRKSGFVPCPPSLLGFGVPEARDTCIALMLV